MKKTFFFLAVAAMAVAASVGANAGVLDLTGITSQLGMDPMSAAIAVAAIGTTFTEGFHNAEYMVSCACGTLSCDQVTLKSGNNLVAGTVLGKVALGAATTSGAGNTGNGTITMDATTPVLASAKLGAYVATCIAAAADGGTFRVEDPDGYVLGDVAVGGTFADDVKFVINDGSADFIVGDKFTITVAAGSGKYTALDLTAIDGSQIAVAILHNETDATSADAQTVACVRLCEVAKNRLTWPDGITNDQKTAALAQLASVGIIGR